MNIIIPTIHVPFIQGGSTRMTYGLANALRRAGHIVEIITMPFKFQPEKQVAKMMDNWCARDFNSEYGDSVDKVIALQFPAYYATHKDKIVWLMHQHRAVYELYDERIASAEVKRLREKIHRLDTDKLSRTTKKFSISKTVSRRLRNYNGLDSVPLYHPPYGEDRFVCEEPYDYIYYPSRLEDLKRQNLLIEALQFTRTPVKAIIAGAGGMSRRYQELINKLRVGDKVRLIGSVTEEEKIAFYSRALAVFFGPYEEDYGYVTLEAMLSSKPVITCTDSGGPLEFVVDGETGLVTEPRPENIAESIDRLYLDKKRSRDMGAAGLDLYRNMNISWSNVVEKLLD